jgi:hypothetical protein
MSGGTTAKAPSFNLAVRLVDARGISFQGEIEATVKWGKGRVPATIDANGVITAVLDGDPKIPGGTLEIRAVRGNAWVTVMTIPLVKHVEREVSADIAPWVQRTSATYWVPLPGPIMAHDVAWRLANLGFLTGPLPSPWTSASGGPARVIPPETSDAMLRFKACHHVELGLDDWLDPATSTSDTRLTGDQDDHAVWFLLTQHDGLSDQEAARKLDHAKKYGQPL